MSYKYIPYKPKFAKKKTEGGSGGKLGHSNMSHWEGNTYVKAHAKTARRLNSKMIVKQEVDDLNK
jgi:hypothetical protein